MGACGVITRILLGIVNVIFLLIGIALVVTASLLKWGNLGNLKVIDAKKKKENVTMTGLFLGGRGGYLLF